MNKIVGIFFLLFGCCIGSNANSDLHPKAFFSKDSVQIGQPVKLTLAVISESNRRLLFPDSSYSFFPFELVRKDFFATTTVNGLSRDSVVYTLQTFFPDSIQSISVPVFEFLGKDSIIWTSNLVSVHVNQILKPPLPSKISIFEESSPVHISTSFNYPYFLIAVGLFFIIVFGINFFFNRPIQKFIYLFIEKRRYQTFLNQFQRIQNQLDKNLNVDGFERLINLWKRYIQRVDGKPYTTFTSTEILKVLPIGELKEPLNEIDRWIYGGVEMKDWRKNIIQIREISIQLYQKKRESIRNGKFE